MKKTLRLVAATVFFPGFVFAQNVGIGTTLPGYKLHVANSSGEAGVGVNATGTAEYALVNLSIDNRADGNALALIKYRAGAAGTTSGIPKSNLAVVTADAGAGALLVSTNQASPIHFATNQLERMRIAANGYIGIGIATPGTLLNLRSTTDHVLIRAQAAGATFVSGLQLGGDFGTTELLRLNSAYPGTLAGIPLGNLTSLYASGGPVLLGNATEDPVYFLTNGALRMKITATGNVGVGYDLPDGKLTVQSNGSYGNPQLLLRQTNDDFGRIRLQNTGGGGFWDIAARTGLAPNSDTLNLYTDAGGNHFSLNGDGRLGLGTLDPVARLHIESHSIGKTFFTKGGIQLTAIGEAAGKVLTSDALGNATWQGFAGTHNHFGEEWTGIASFGLRILNNNTAAATGGIQGVASGFGVNKTVGVQGLSNSTQGIGVLGIASTSGYPVAAGNSGVAGTSIDGNGVFGVASIGLSIYGYKGGAHTGSTAKFENVNPANGSPVVQIVNSATNPISLEINGGFIKSTGAVGNKTAFVVTAVTGGGGNTTGNGTTLAYNNPLSTDILIVTHHWQGSYIGAIGIYFTGGVWKVFRDDGVDMPSGEKFNVLVVKQ